MSDGMEGRDNFDFYSASLWLKVLCSSMGIVLISARKMSFFFISFFFFAFNTPVSRLTSQRLHELRLTLILTSGLLSSIDISSYMVESTHPKCLTHLLCASVFPASYILVSVLVSANATAFSFRYNDLSSLLLSNFSILLPYFITQLTNNFYILKYVILLLNIFAKCF